MALYSVDSGSYVTNVPHKKDYDRWMKNLSSADLQKIEDELNQRFDQKSVNTAGWIPGPEWEDTVYYPIYRACNKNVTQAGMFFGLIVWETLRNRSDVWGFGKYEIDGVQIGRMTYFLINTPPTL